MSLSTVIDREQQSLTEVKNPRQEAASVYDLHVLVSRMDEGETRARPANLPLPEQRASTVREALQQVVDAARTLIHDCVARDRAIPWIEPPALPDETESRFIVPLTL